MIDITDDGYVRVKLAGCEQPLDLWQTFNRLRELRADMQDQPPSAFNAKLVEYLKAIGFPAVSTKAAVAFATRIYEAVGELEKKGESPESLAPNAS